MLLKLHNYFNWADKKLHTAFFIENKDSINEDLLTAFKGGSDLEVNPGFAAKKPKVVEKKKPAGFQQQAKNLFSNPAMMHMGNRSEDVVNVNSQSDFPSLGSAQIATAHVRPAAQAPPPRKNKKGKVAGVEVKANPTKASTWGMGMFEDTTAQDV